MEGRTLLSLSVVPGNAGYPYSAVVELQATFPDRKIYTGSGVMVDGFHVLTAGHLIYSSADGGFATSIIATPELDGSSRPFGSARMTYERTFRAFVNYNRFHVGTTRTGDYDIALITPDRDIGDSAGWMAYGDDNNTADFAPGTVYSTAGYPAAGGL
jgi:V8-like Glu-specific endopeptidase